VPTDPTDDDDVIEQLVGFVSDRPEADQPFGDSEPSVSIPEAPSVPEYGTDSFDSEELSSDLSDVDSDLLSVFTVCVLLTKVGVLLVSAGILLVVFRGHLEFGGGLVLVGSVALVRVVHKYRTYTHSQAGNESDPTEHNG